MTAETQGFSDSAIAHKNQGNYDSMHKTWAQLSQLKSHHGWGNTHEVLPMKKNYSRYRT